MFYTLHVIPKLNSEDDPVVQHVIDMITFVARATNVRVVGRDEIEGHTLVVAVGGDGTMLEAMRVAALYDATALGVNLGRVGFLSDLNIQDPKHGSLTDAMTSILTRRVATSVEHRTVLVSTIDDRTLACNEFSVSPTEGDTMLTYHLRIGSMSAGVHRANSILIATATGSTAYSLSAGGALMMPGLDAIQIVPVAPMTMTSRPILVPNHMPITVEVCSPGVSIRADGQRIHTDTHPFTRQSPYSITVRRYIREAKVLHLEGWNFFDTLTQKLGWIKE